MKRILFVMVLLLVFAGCHHADFAAFPVVKEQPAPHDGWMIGPWVQKGASCPGDGWLIWFGGSDPNDLLGDQ